MTSDEPDESISSEFRRLRESLDALTWPVERLQKTLRLDRVTTRFPTPRWSTQMDQIGRAATRIVQELPERQRETLIKMAQYGWYMDAEMGLNDSVRWARALAGPNAEAASAELCGYFENRIDSLEAALRDKYPHRADVLRAAFNAHRRGDYYCSTPVLLSQTEGICNELVGQSPYSRPRKDGQSVLRTIISSFRPARAALAAPLGDDTPLTAGRNAREASKPILNRHAILHGESVDYGTREVSARAISFLANVSWVLDTKDEETNSTGGISSAPSSGEVQ